MANTNGPKEVGYDARHRAPPVVHRLHRAWHATLGRLVKKGHLPRKLTDVERRNAQVRVFDSPSVWGTTQRRAEAVMRRLSAASDEDIAWQVWLHGVIAPPNPDAPEAVKERLGDVEERLAVLTLDGELTEQQARRRVMGFPD